MKKRDIQIGIVLVISAVVLGVIVAYLCGPVFACHWSRYDLNRDGKIDMCDLTFLCAHYNHAVRDGHERRCDLTGNGFIDIFDVVTWIFEAGYGIRR